MKKKLITSLSLIFIFSCSQLDEEILYSCDPEVNEYVLENLREANFDPEFFDKFEEEVVKEMDCAGITIPSSATTLVVMVHYFGSTGGPKAGGVRSGPQRLSMVLLA